MTSVWILQKNLGQNLGHRHLAGHGGHDGGGEGGVKIKREIVWAISHFSPEILYCFKMIFRVWNTFCMTWDFL